jgi:hypothetical protein
MQPTKVSKYYDINFQLPLSNAGISAMGAQTDTENTIRKNNIQSEIKANNKKISGEDYKRLPKEDGGYSFIDPQGNEISAYQYARATGRNSAEVLADSDNPIDTQYRTDYDYLQGFLNAATSGDKESLDAYYAEKPQLKSLSPRDVFEKFKAAYPTVYGTRKTGQPLGSTSIPSNQAVENRLSGYGDTSISE